MDRDSKDWSVCDINCLACYTILIASLPRKTMKRSINEVPCVWLLAYEEPIWRVRCCFLFFRRRMNNFLRYCIGHQSGVELKDNPWVQVWYGCFGNFFQRQSDKPPMKFYYWEVFYKACSNNRPRDLKAATWIVLGSLKLLKREEISRNAWFCSEEEIVVLWKISESGWSQVDYRYKVFFVLLQYNILPREDL